ncbi:MAG: hypothetical protein LBU90_04925 [Bacteroidales bacterium]|jgi:antitoxin component YwqK of YwqJK toxin-antitoxin module|nr:hypothetical protein [Bacteroidales bacterium]
MKYLFVFLNIFASCALCAQSQAVELHNLQKNDNLYVYNNQAFTGTVYARHANGNIGLWGNIENGKREGVWTYWYSSGIKKRETNFVNNQKEGYTYFWHENGTLAKELYFRANQNISQKLWNSNGNRLKSPQYHTHKQL